jgi:RNA-directed DNA polymerase
MPLWMAPTRRNRWSCCFPGDDLFTPAQRRRGLPIGNLTSQWFANLYLDGFDHFVKEVLRAPYVRYVDDFRPVSRRPGSACAIGASQIARYLEGRRLRIAPAQNLCGVNRAEDARLSGLCAVHTGGLRRLPEDNVRRFRNRLRGLRDRWQAGTVATEEIVQRVSSWIAHGEHAHTPGACAMRSFAGGWFDPFWTVGT